MAFGDFLAGAGEVGIGAADMQQKNNFTRQQNIANENAAADLRAKQQAEQSTNAAAGAANDVFNSTVGGNVGQVGSGSLPTPTPTPAQTTPAVATPAPAAQPASTPAPGTFGAGLERMKYLQAQRAALMASNPAANPPPYAAEDERYQPYAKQSQAWVDQVAANAKELSAAQAARVQAAQASKRLAQIRPMLDTLKPGDPIRNRLLQEYSALTEANRDYFDPPTASTGAAPNAPRPEFVAAIRSIESGGNMNAVSPKGATSDMQVMPKTAANPGYGVTPARDNSLAEKSRVGADYLNAMYKKYNGNEALTAVAYNMGPTATDAWIQNGADVTKLPAETQGYLQKLHLQLNGPTPAASTSAAQPTPQDAAAQPTPGQPTAPAAPQAVGQFNTYAMNGTDPESALRQQQMDYWRKVGLASSGASKLQALQKYQALQQDQLSNDVLRLGYAASAGDHDAMNALVGRYATFMGVPDGLGFAKTNDGGVAVVTKGGQILAHGQQPSDLVGQIMSTLNPNIRNANIQTYMTEQTEAAKARGKAAGEGPLELAKIQAQGGSQAVLESIKNNGAVQQLLLKAGIDANEMQAPVVNNVNGTMTFYTKGGRQWVLQEPKTDMLTGWQLNPVAFNTGQGTPSAPSAAPGVGLSPDVQSRLIASRR